MLIISLIVSQFVSPLGKCLKRTHVLRYRISGFEVFDSPGINNLGSLCSLETFGPCSQNTRNPGYYYLGNQIHANDLLKCIMFSMQCEDTWWPASKWVHLLSTCCLLIISLIIWKIMFPLGKCLRRIQVLRYRIPGFEVFDSPGINNLGSLCSLETFGPCLQNTLNPGY